MPSNLKLRGGYYTPQPISDFLANWAIRTPSDAILEPSCGDGVLIESSVKVLKRLGANTKSINEQVIGIELDKEESLKAYERVSSINNLKPTIIQGDFFKIYSERLLSKNKIKNSITINNKFDVVIGNPPFIRYQDFPSEQRKIAFDLIRNMGLNPSGLSNSWLPFLILSISLLNDQGRLAMVVPAELFQVGYASEARHFLSECFSKLTIITFKELVFPNIQQEVILLLGEHNGVEGGGIHVIELDNLKGLDNLEINSHQKVDYKPMDHSAEKWTQYFLDKDEIMLLRELHNHSGIIKLGKIIQVNVGVVTGRNKFFLLTNQEVEKLDISQSVVPIVSRSAYLKGVVFENNDWIQNRNTGYPSYLFTPSDDLFDRMPDPVKEYILLGEKEEIHTGYKCRIRKNWYIVPSVWKPDAFMLRQVHSYPKIILNNSKATSTDTIHRVRINNGYDPEQIAAGFINSLTFAFSEVTGRSYGGGVLTFEPSEAEILPLPMNNINKLDVQLIDKLVRNNEVEKALDITDEVLLVDGLGLGIKDIRKLRRIWHKLRERRINRKSQKSQNK